MTNRPTQRLAAGSALLSIPDSAGHASALKVNNSSGDRDSSNMRADMPFGEPFG
jgi:hypothetical protein